MTSMRESDGNEEQHQHQQTETKALGEGASKQKPSTLIHVGGFIVGTELCERMAYYGIGSSLVLYMQRELNMANAEADMQYALWSGMCYVIPLVGAYLADCHWGRYKTIAILAMVYVLGLVVTALSTMPLVADAGHSLQTALLFLGMYIITLGSGLKSSVSTFGADQFDPNCPQDEKEKPSFFSWFYFSINVGAFVSFTAVSYICQYGIPQLGGLDWAFTVGWSIPCIAMAAAVVVFLSGTHKYKVTGAQGASVLSKSLTILKDAVLVAAGITKQGSQPHQQQRRPVVTVPSSAGVSPKLCGEGQDAAGACRVEKGLPLPLHEVSLEEGGADNGVVEGVGDAVLPKKTHWLDRVSASHGGKHSDQEVKDVKSMWLMVPMLALQIPFWAVYSQSSTALQNQACQMDLNLGSFSIPIAAMNNFDTIAILLLIPLLDRVVYPMMLARRAKKAAVKAASSADTSTSSPSTDTADAVSKDSAKPAAVGTISPLSKVAWGFMFAGLGMLFAGFVEMKRKAEVGAEAPVSACFSGDASDYSYQQFQTYYQTGSAADEPSNCWQLPGCDTLTAAGLLAPSCIGCDTIPLASTLSILWQIPAFVFGGISEILAVVSMYEFFYDGAPLSMKSTAAALNLLCTALGSWITIPLISLVNTGGSGKEWVPADLNDGYLERYFFLLAGIMALDIVAFLLWVRRQRRAAAQDAAQDAL